MSNITNIPAPRVGFIDERTGLMSREWYLFFLNLFTLTGSGGNAVSLEELQVGPISKDVSASIAEATQNLSPAPLKTIQPDNLSLISNVSGELSNFYSQAQLSGPSAPKLGTLASKNIDNVPFIGFANNPSPSVPNPAPTGTLYWDGGTTLNLQMTQNVLHRVGESSFVYVKASAAITKGQLVKSTGAVGASGTITAAPTSTGMTVTTDIVGVAAEDIALNGFGLIQKTGLLRGFDTTGSSVGEVWADGDPLYYNPSFVGSFTKTIPTSPNIKTYAAQVVNAAAGASGSITVYLIHGPQLNRNNSDVQVSGLANNDLLQYNSGSGYWKNSTAASVSVGSSTNLVGGAAGSVPYQTGSGTTTFLAVGSANQVLKVNGGGTAPTWVSGAALTKTDDTNVTLTLGGTPTSSLLAATSLTLGWTGTLAVARGGTGTGTASIAAFNNITGYTASGATGTTSTNLVFSAVPSFDTTIGVGAATAASSGAGITFPATQSVSSNANTLDDYEEGTWTATLTCGTSGTITLNSSYNTGSYTKIGRIVTITGIFLVDSVSAPVGILYLNGLPFPVENIGNYSRSAAAVFATDLAATATTSIIGKALPGESRVQLYKYAAGAQSNLSGDVVANSQFYVTLTYIAG